MPTLRYKFGLLFIILFSTFQWVDAQNIYSKKIADHIQRFKTDSLPFTDEQYDFLTEIESWTAQNGDISKEYFDLLDNYLNYLNKKTFRKYASQVYYDIFSQALYILQISKNPDIDMKKWTYSLLPDYYSAVKILIPEEVSKNATQEMALNRPQELIGQFSRLDYVQDAKDLETAILASPHTFSQFMHYNNLVKLELKKSTRPEIKLLFDIYDKYRYSQHPYYLFPYIVKGQLTIEKAEEISKNEPSLINYLLPLVIDTSLLARVSIDQRWDEIASKYVKIIKSNTYTPTANWKMDALDQIADSSRIRILFITNNLFNPKELEAYMKWISFKNGNRTFSTNLLDMVPLQYVFMLREKIRLNKLDNTWDQLWGVQIMDQYIAQRKKEADPKELEFLTSSSITHNTSSTTIDNTIKPKIPEYVIKTYYFHLSEQDKNLIKWKSDPLNALEKVSEWIDEPFANKLMEYISQAYPLEIIRSLNQLKLKKVGIDALKNVGKIAPLTAKNYIIQPTHPWNYLFKNSQDSVIKILFKINEIAGIKTRAYILLDDIYHKKLSVLEADSICRNNYLLTQRIIQLLAKPDVLGKYSLEEEISATALKFIRNLNISENTDQYFSDNINYLNAEALYTFMTYGEDEIIQRSFYKMLQALISKSPQGNIFPIIQKLGFNNYKKFFRKCAYYDLLDTVLQAFSSSQKNQLVRMTLADLDKAEDNDIIQVADIIISLSNPNIIEMVEQQLKIEYENAENKKSDKGVAIYGILSSLLSTKIDHGWAKYVAEKYKLPDVEQLPTYELFNNQMVNVQQYFFYNDDDGVSSYNNFIRSYERNPVEWNIKDLGSFVLIQSKTGRKIDLFANKAMDGEAGISDMISYMKKNALQPQVVVHRGLSTHTLKTFTRIPSSAKLILDGSCGGYYLQQVALDRAHNAQILCNRNVGTMYVNDPLFKQINDDIRAGKDIIWPDFWAKMSQRVGNNPYFRDYIPPHKNAAAILIKALYDILEIN